MQIDTCVNYVSCSVKLKNMKLTFCPVDLPEETDIETIEYQSTEAAYQAAYEFLSKESKKHNQYFAVIWTERGNFPMRFGEHFSICLNPNEIFSPVSNLISSIYSKNEDNINIYCFATFEEAFDYAKDYCHGVWPSPEDALN